MSKFKVDELVYLKPSVSSAKRYESSFPWKVLSVTDDPETNNKPVYKVQSKILFTIFSDIPEDDLDKYSLKKYGRIIHGSS